MSATLRHLVPAGATLCLLACTDPAAPTSAADRTGGSVTSAARTAEWQITVLPTLWGYSEVRAINAAGAAAGFSMVEGSLEHPVIWRDGNVVDLGTLGGAQGEALDVNAGGEVVGWAQAADGRPHGFRWSDGNMTALPSPGVSSVANAISPSGVIVGATTDAFGRVQAVRWADGTYELLPTLGGPESEATDIAPSGDIVGWSSLPGGERHATLWHDGQPVDLGVSGLARAISASGIVVGLQYTPTGFGLFAWRAGALDDVSVPDAEYGSDALGVNASGTIVGRSLDADALNAIVIEHGIVTRLPRLPGSSYARAYDVNERGDVAGYSLLPDVIGARAVIWTRK